MTLGITNGTTNYGWESASNGYPGVNSSHYGWRLGQGVPGTTNGASDRLYGITTDPAKSGIVTSLDNLSIGEVNSMKLGKYILKY